MDTEKTVPQRFPKYLLSGLYFLPRGGLLLIHVISLDLSHFAKSAVWVGTDVCEFGRGSFFSPLDVACQFVFRKPGYGEFVGLLKSPGSLMKMQTSVLIQS